MYSDQTIFILFKYLYDKYKMYLSYVFILLSCVNARYLQGNSSYPVKPSFPFINFDVISTPDTQLPTPIPTPVPTPIDTPIPTPVPTPIDTPVPIPIETQLPTPVSTPIEPTDTPTEIIINPTPPSIDPLVTKQLKSIYRICVGTFVMLLIFFIVGFGIFCKLCLNRY